MTFNADHDQAHEPLSRIDSAWLRMDRPTNLMMICGLMMLSGRLTLPQARAVIGTRLLCFHRFRQRVVQGGERANTGGDAIAHWEDDPGFDANWHVRHIALPGKAGRAELEEVCSDLVSTALDPSKPMWQFHVIDTADGNSALLLRIHHCYGDGYALAHVINGLTDADPQHPAASGHDIGAAPPHGSWERMLGPQTESIADMLRLAWSLAGTAGDWIAHPSHAVDAAREGLDLLSELAVIAGMTPDASTLYKGEQGVMKRVAWADPLPLFDVQAVAEAHACSVNDVLLCCVTGALRSYLVAHGEMVAAIELRAMVPVNLRPPGPVTELGNRFGLFILSLPISEEDPIARLLQVHQRMRQLKRSRQATATLAILAAIALAPEAVREQAMVTLAANASAVISNVRGPSEPRYFAGQRIAHQLFWVPQSGGIGVGISLLSHAGSINFGVVTDVKRVPDPAQLATRFHAEFEALLLSTLMMR
ncbi:MAG: diacylglycerol O-acyltransferase [Janthinobacterium sp.]|jgi:diacylglycerol O-acyltransferase